jgi:protease-4
VDVISSGRDLPEDRVREIADGRIYSGQRARELGLVDSFGGLDEASAEARELAKVGQATVVRYVQSPTFTDALLSGLAGQPTEAERVMSETGITLEPKPYYLYLPGA